MKSAHDLVLMAKEETVLQGINIHRLIEIVRRYRIEVKVENLK
jgi:hypothetical protein